MSDDPSKLHRRNDMDTSIEAAERILGIKTVIQQRVWQYALGRGPEGFTDWELRYAMAERFESNNILQTSTYRTRRSELTRLGLIVDTGRRKTHPPGHRRHAIWQVQPPPQPPQPPQLKLL